MIMRISTVFCAAAVLAVPGVSRADFNYLAVEFSFVDVEYDVSIFNVDGDGFRIGGTVPLGESFYVGGEYSDYGFDFGVDGELIEIGGGYFTPLREDLDFVATFSYLDAEVSAGPSSADDDGFSIGGGVRAQLADSVQVDAMLKFVDMDQGDSDTGLEVRGRYYFNEDFAVQAGLGLGTDFDTLTIGIRAEF
jgi:opacity protein-like surface antigen